MTQVATSTDLRAVLDTAPMSRAQVIAVLLVGALSALDGYDILAVSFAAPGLTRAWELGPAQIGLILSSGLAGMGAGALLLAPFADRFGRQKLLTLTLALMGIGMLVSAFAQSLAELAIWRVITGVGIGAMVAIINPLSSEFANARRRPLAVAVMAVGYPIGGTLGGFAAAWLLQHYDWPAVFLLGAGAAAVMAPMLYLWLPESPAYLLARRGPDSLDKMNVLLGRFGQPPVNELPPVEPPQAPPYREIFGPDQVAATIRVTAVNFLFVITVYYTLSWMPQLVATHGFSPAAATAVSAICNLSGVVAGLIVGILGARLPLRAIVATLMFGLGATTTLFGYMPADIVLLSVMAALAGICLFGAMAGLYATIAATFPPRMRVTGVGFVTGIGRGGSAIAPSSAGLLFAAGMARGGVSLAIGATAALAAVILLLPVRKPRD